MFKFLFLIKGTIVGQLGQQMGDSGVGIAMNSHIIEFPTRDEADFAASALEGVFPESVTKLYKDAE